MNKQARTERSAHFLENLISRRQLAAIVAGCRGEESAWFRAKLVALAKIFATMHKIYEQDGAGDAAIVHLHYFTSSGDWYITERDTSVAQHQAFGVADLGYGPELGYISIAELIANGAELDLHWTPCTLGEARAKKAIELLTKGTP
jgi:hypothetical protein